MSEKITQYHAIPLGGDRNIHKDLSNAFKNRGIDYVGGATLYDFPDEEGGIISKMDSGWDTPITILDNLREDIRAFVEIKLGFVLKEITPGNVK